MESWTPSQIWLHPPTQQNRHPSTWEKKDEERVEGVENLDSNAKCRYLKNWPVKGLCGSCFSVCGPLPSYDPMRPPYTLYTCLHTEQYTYSHREGGRGGGVANQREG